MNEEQKNIETCLPEDVLAEVANVPTDPQFRSLVEESFDPLQQQALQQAGYDGYKEVVMYHQPYTFTSQVKQMKSNLILLLRRLWRFPFGRGTTASSAAGSSAASDAGSSAASAAAPIRSLADMWQHYITRLKGNPEYGIPSRLSSLTDLPDAPALLADRKISGAIGAPDGISLVRLTCDSSVRNSIKSIIDNSSNGWVMTHSLPNYQNLEELELHCASALDDVKIAVGISSLKRLHVPMLKTLTTKGEHITGCGVEGELELPEFTTYSNSFGGAFICYMPNMKVLKMPKVTMINGDRIVFCNNNNSLEEVYATQLTDLGGLSEIAYTGSVGAFNNNPKLWKVEFGVYPKIKFRMGGGGQYSPIPTEKVGYFRSCPNLIHLEPSSINFTIYLNDWSPTNALDASRTDLIEEGSTAANNLEQFLSNFKAYIAERLTDNGTGLTLTLSQEVRNAIHAAEDEYGIENIIITQKGWTISPAPN